MDQFEDQFQEYAGSIHTSPAPAVVSPPAPCVFGPDAVSLPAVWTLLRRPSSRQRSGLSEWLESLREEEQLSWFHSVLHYNSISVSQTIQGETIQDRVFRESSAVRHFTCSQFFAGGFGNLFLRCLRFGFPLQRAVTFLLSVTPVISTRGGGPLAQGGGGELARGTRRLGRTPG